MLNFDPKSQQLREEYIDEITRGLRGKETALEVYEQGEELRAHLNALAEAHIEMGVEPAVAMKVAIESFGEAKVISEGLGIKPETTTPPENAHAYFMLLAPACFLGGLLLIAFDAWWSLVTGQRYHTDFKMDFLIGATFGFFALILGVQVKKSPRSLGRIVTAVGAVLIMLWFGPQLFDVGPQELPRRIVTILTLLPLMYTVGYAARSMVLMVDSARPRKA